MTEKEMILCSVMHGIDRKDGDANGNNRSFDKKGQLLGY